MLHKCTDTECPLFGQRTSKSCGCHQTDEQVLRAENERLRKALEPFAEPHALGDDYVKFSPFLIEDARRALEGLDQHTSKVA